MPQFRGSPRGRVVVTRRSTSWQVGVGGTGLTNISLSTSVFLGSAIQAVTDGATVIRIRGELLVWMSLATASNDGFSGAFGIGLATFAGVTAGIGSVPTPITEDSSDSWLWHRFFSVKSPVLFAQGAGQGGPDTPTSFWVEIDSKAMRKLPTELSIYAAIEVVETGTAQMHVQLDTRTLIKLP